MKKSVHIKIILLISALVLVFFRAGATNIYISTNGTASVAGSTLTDPAPFSALQAYLSAYQASDDRTLNIYFAAGTYSVVSPLTFPTRTYVNNLAVTMSPSDLAGESVIFDGSSAGSSATAVRFIATSEMNASTSMTLNINDVTIRNFTSTTGTSDVGGTSLITANVSTAVNLDKVVIDNISSGRNPLVTVRRYATFTATNSTIKNITNSNTYSVLNTWTSDVTIKLDNCLLENWKSNASSGTYRSMISLQDSRCSLELTGDTIRNCSTSLSLINAYDDSPTMTVSGNTFIGNTVTSGAIVGISSGNAKINNNTFSDNTATYVIYAAGTSANIYENTSYANHAASDIIYVSGGSTNIYNNTFRNETTATRIVNIYSGSSSRIHSIYNNTFSGNTAALQAIDITTTYARAYNNTSYLSGGINMTGNYSHVVNNILVGGTITGTASYITARCKRNIVKPSTSASYYATGNTAGTDITTAFGRQFNAELTLRPGPGRQVHHLREDEDLDHVILGKGGTLRSLSQDLGIPVTSTLIYDQLGSLRPGRISIGSIDLQEFIFTPEGTISSIYNSEGDPTTPQPVSCDLSQFIDTYPDEVDKTNTIFEIVSNPANGTITQETPGSYNVVFTPTPGVMEGSSRFTVTVAAIDEFDFVHKETFTVRTFIYDIASHQKPDSIAPGYLDGDKEACFDFMGTVEFTSAYRFISSEIAENQESNSGANRLYGFSIPLVGDLNGDSYPEIIGAWGGGLAGDYKGIVIYNGQTGRVIQRLPYPGISENPTYADGYSSSGNHSTPSTIALVDSDGDKEIELIAALPAAGGDSKYRQKVISFNIKYQDGKYTLEERWRSRDVYTTLGSSYEKPIPQIVDIDGDGRAEVVVYNKIYDAAAKIGDGLSADGLLDPIIVLEENGTPFVGSEPEARAGDRWINFSYIYDVDMDGKYDIVAGGKIYYDINIHKTIEGGAPAPYYRTMEMIGVKDGRTGVADINGDGIPDVVSATRKDNNFVELTVWNPNFWKVEDGEIVPGSRVPEIIAECDLPFYNGGTTGNSSYVYIGDIDGVVQRVDGKEYRLPEIAVLGGRFDFSEIKQHPEVPLGAMPTSGTSADDFNGVRIGSDGVLAGLTWDATPGLDKTERLKLSFILGHDDSSIDTGFTMFDFDNDGTQEICYRDERTIRIIKAARPLISDSETNPDVILFSRPCYSYTGFEYPVIADIDNDASAEIIVVGRTNATVGQAWGFIFAIGNGDGDKFAPAWTIWNQFMYDPFKITPRLTVPQPIYPDTVYEAPNRLAYSFKKIDPRTNETFDFYPYNGTLIQATKFTMTLNSAHGHVYDPIVFLTESYIIGNNNNEEIRGSKERPELSGTDGEITFTITVGNYQDAQTDISINTPVAIYRNGSVSVDNYVGTFRLDTFRYAGTDIRVNEPIKADPERFMFGNSKRISFTLTGEEAKADDVYILRLGDSSGYDEYGFWEWRYGMNSDVDGEPDPDRGIGVAQRRFRDCDWSDQSVMAAKLNIFPDAATVQAYDIVSINVLNNDILPEDYFGDSWSIDNDITQEKLNTFTIMQQPVAGNLTLIGAKENLRVTYRNTRTDNLTNSVDSFVYRTVFMDPTISTTVSQKRTTTVYIYVLQGEGGFATCDDNFLVSLKELPSEEHVRFLWWNGDDSFLQEGPTRRISNMKADSLYFVEPRISREFSEAHFRNVSFPAGVLAIEKEDPDNPSVMRWKGTESTNWYDPANWVVVKDGAELPTFSTPTSCTDVTIPSGVPYYPMLTNFAVCNDIRLEDRAMIAGIHHLGYEDASVEIKLKPVEKDRFIMWSAPLMSMYSGDYHYRRNGEPQWGDVYMNLFQHATPSEAAEAAKVNTFTATFGELDEPLGLGKAFNLKVTATTVNRDKSFNFPEQNEMSYPSATGDTIYNTSQRTNGSKFIADGVEYDDDYEFDLPVVNDVAGSNLVQIVNPYMAYLDMEEFLDENDDILTETYAVWDGHITNSFTQIGTFGDGGQRYTIATIPGNSVQERYIAPLQSFFVQKRSTSKLGNGTVKMSPAWTTTLPGGPYELRSSEEEQETNILRVQASQGDRSSYTALFYHSAAHPDYNCNEDMHKLFYNEIPLEVYSFAPSKEALAIQASSNFEGQDVGLGIRAKNVGKVTLEFSGMETFGHRVFLVDKALIGKEQVIEMTESNPSYTFTVAKPNTELNDRFSLRMNYTGVGLSAEETGQEDVLISSGDGHIYIQSSAAPFSDVQVYNISGALMYTDSRSANYLRIEADRGQVYVVKLKTGTEHTFRKILVR